MLEAILAKEEEHVDDMKTLLETIGKEERATRALKTKGMGPPCLSGPGCNLECE